MTLGEKQELFAELLGRLLEEIHAAGFRVRLKELLRTEGQARIYANTCAICGGPQHDISLARGHYFKPLGIANSVHCAGLAIDLVIANPSGVIWAAEFYEPFGRFWEGLHPLARWGGRFHDAGHFSLEHEGRM